MTLFLIGCVILVTFLIGPSGLIGLAFIIFEVFIIDRVTRRTMTMRLEIGKFTDSRIKAIYDTINNIRIIKLYGWEIPFLKKIFESRAQEINVYWKKTALYTIN